MSTYYKPTDTVYLTHLPLVPQICAINWVIIGLDNGLLSVWCQAIISINDGFSSITSQGTSFIETTTKTNQMTLTK